MGVRLRDNRLRDNQCRIRPLPCPRDQSARQVSGLQAKGQPESSPNRIAHPLHRVRPCGNGLCQNSAYLSAVEKPESVCRGDSTAVRRPLRVPSFPVPLLFGGQNRHRVDPFSVRCGAERWARLPGDFDLSDHLTTEHTEHTEPVVGCFFWGCATRGTTSRGGWCVVLFVESVCPLWNASNTGPMGSRRTTKDTKSTKIGERQRA